VKSHDEIEAELHALGWRITSGPSRTADGWKVTAQRGSSSVQITGWTKLGVLEDLLRYAQERAKGKP
jgi:hypothetical protein